jgi:AraC-like DNA-binding protein
MSESPDFFADRPASADGAAPRGAPPSDVLSDLLRAVRLRGESIYCFEQSPPFAVPFKHPGGTIHIVKEGHVQLQLDDAADHACYQHGDVVMLPAGKTHTLRSGTEAHAPGPAPADGTPPGPATTRWLSGTFSFEECRGSQLLHGSPPIVELRGAGDQSLVWLDVSSEMLVKETTSPTQGSREMISRILDLLFIQVLRAWASGPDAAPGWLTGAMDPEIGDAIGSIHASPSHPWTIEKLAAKSNLSRSAFAERFSRRVGQPPATYIAQVRLGLAADLLLDTSDSISAIANRVGYDSEAAFSRAFSRQHGQPPSRWRRQPSTAGFG